MPGMNLTRLEAAERAELLTVTSYEVSIDLTTSAQSFPTSSVIHFSCRRPGAETFLDFVGESVESICLNGTDLDPAQVYDDHRIVLTDLAEENTLEVHATGRYMHTGEGLHRFVDPVDDQVYLYTQFETADSRRMFPVFEQPDLKATFAFTITAPAHWQVISTQTTPTPTAVGEREVPQLGTIPVARWEFAPTPRLSSYVTALIAGPYDVVRDSVAAGDRQVPLGLFCRKSLTPYLDADEVLDITKRGFAFYADLFDLPYPFEKYDQIFTPEYNAGAMENVGAVTYNEMYVFRAKVTDAIVERRALTILHELAHMWFGNLVTMRWWDDLWLNESFAEWASMTCQAEATRWNDAWATFATSGKSWALRQDQLSSTHPVAADIRHLHDVEVNFDGITYAKGASALKQLVAYVGREPFVEGLRSYFREFAYGNTTLADLLRHLETTSGRDLAAWTQAWLQTAGPNTLRTELDLDGDVIRSAAVLQEAPSEYPTMRPHRLAIGVYDVADGTMIRRHRIETDIVGERTEIPELAGTVMPDLLLLNDDDLTYAKVRLDRRSVDCLLTHAGRAPALPRAILRGAAWDMTRDAELPGREFVQMLWQVLPTERDSTLLAMTLGQLGTTISTYVDPQARPQLRADAASRLMAFAQQAEPGTDAQLQLVTSAAGWAHCSDQLDWVQGIYDGSAPLAGLAVDTEMRWTLLTALVMGGRASEEDIAEEERRDPTATGRERAARARAAIPTAAAKTAAWDLVFSDSSLPNQTVSAVLAGWAAVHDESLLTPFVERYHGEIRELWDQRTYAIGEDIVVGAYPLRLASPQVATATERWLDEHRDAPDGLRRLIAENRDAVTRAVRAQECDARSAR
ncbi:Aminopeptidase N [Austwickia sp. TVS 96-490-7B]|uniref:aminopeptidase N n=1 Tax=Austwickia sp. TVS 96-490-7B TaxID=2830843 RepID=UPI001C5734C7|nr:aminopeptidase N [Austwickia sp. TVS 96-490-7B]MBW3086523.1 Aminopeptidase N [Austwickia sp. TVS 96-490-7B]